MYSVICVFANHKSEKNRPTHRFNWVVCLYYDLFQSKTHYHLTQQIICESRSRRHSLLIYHAYVHFVSFHSLKLRHYDFQSFKTPESTLITIYCFKNNKWEETTYLAIHSIAPSIRVIWRKNYCRLLYTYICVHSQM